MNNLYLPIIYEIQVDLIKKFLLFFLSHEIFRVHIRRISTGLDS